LLNLHLGLRCLCLSPSHAALSSNAMVDGKAMSWLWEDCAMCPSPFWQERAETVSVPLSATMMSGGVTEIRSGSRTGSVSC